jgi:anti-sigma-K factor RskA
MNCQEFEELSGAYALDALTEEERRAADEHLAQCPKCTRALQQLRSVVELFPLTVPPVEPSPRVKERILARIEAQARQPGAAGQQGAVSTPSHPAAESQRSRHRRRLWGLPSLIAAALLLAVLLGGMTLWNLTLQQQISQLQQQVAQLSAPESPLIYPLHGTSVAQTARGQVMYFPRQQTTIVVVYGLPPLQGTHVYQGWLLQNRHPTSIGLFTVQNGIATLNFQGRLSGYDTLAISLEASPQPSLATPKGPIVALGTLINSSATYH